MQRLVILLKKGSYWGLLVLIILVCAVSTLAQVSTTYKDKETGVEFPSQIEQAGKRYDIITTGRIKASFIVTFNVCAFGFYMETGKFDKNKQFVPQMINDETAKIIVVHFLRN
ncbi:MAG: hypothetical protein AB1489_31910, partial [Acidobacteriota bacterium]